MADSPRDAAHDQCPEIDGNLCVHGRTVDATCTACVKACPEGALSLCDDGLMIDVGRCDGCGLCAAVCPESAIEAKFATTMRDVRGQGVAFVACDTATSDDGAGVVPCVHAISMRALFQLHDRGIYTLWVAEAPCDTCRRGACMRLESVVDTVNQYLSARDQPALAIRLLPVGKWRAARDGAEVRRRDNGLGRRSLLKGMVSTLIDRVERQTVADEAPRPKHRPPLFADGDTALLPFVPEIDSERCSGCDACVRLCAHGAITLRRDGDNTHYGLKANRCSGCMLCVDVCRQHAISIGTDIAPTQLQLPLRRQVCARCGTPFHMPGDQALESATCWVCRETGRKLNLFQVLA